MSNDDVPIEPPSSHAIEFTVQGKWAHFRRIDTTTVRQSYRVIPPTTVMGLIAALLGYSRDSYYETFSKPNAAFAIIVDEPISPFQLAKLDLGTEDGTDFESGSAKGPLRNLISRKSTNENRQQRLYEYLRDPTYRIIAAIDDESIRTELSNRLADRKFEYAPSLGRSECIAAITDWDEYQLSAETVDEVDSTVPLEVARVVDSVSVERTPQRMTAETHSRRATDFISYSFSKAGESIPVVEGTEAYSAGQDTVLFV